MAWTKVATPRIATILCFAAMPLIPSLALGADPVGRFSLSARFGVSGYRMEAINDAISASNHRLSQLQPEWKVPDRIHSGFDFVADAAYDISNAFRIGIVYGTTSASANVDYLQAIEVNPQAGMIMPRVFYRVPWRPMIDMSLRVFAGWLHFTDARTKIKHEDTSEGSERLEAMTVKGSGNGFVAGLTGEYTLSDTFTLSVEAGYRAAKAGYDSGSWRIDKLANPGAPSDRCEDLTYDKCLLEESYLWGFLNEKPPLARGQVPTVREDLDGDFSGVVLQIGLRVYIF